MAECHGIHRAFQHPDVRIGWAPYVALRATEIRSNPGAGTLIKSVPKGGGLGYQSVRNPSGSPSPPLRAWTAVYGVPYAWVYSRAGDKTGWVKAEDIGPDPDAASKSALTGPGGYDFEVDRTPPLPKKPNGCGKVSLTKPLRAVKSRDTYLRYSARGTAFHYLHEGDVVKLYIVNAPAGFAFCEVVDSRQGSPAVPGARGWILQESLTPVPPENPGP